MRERTRETRGRFNLNPRPNAHGVASLKRERRELNHRLGGQHAVLLVHSHRRVARRVIEDCLYFFSGRWYGKDIVAYLTKENRRSKWLKVSKAKVRESERLMRQYGVAILLVLPGALTCFAYGMAKRGSRRRTFLFLDSLGAALRVVLFRVAGKGAKKALGLSAVRYLAAVGMKYKELAMTVGGTVLAVIGAGVYYYFYY